MKAKDLAAILLNTPELEVTYYDPFSDTHRRIVGVCGEILRSDMLELDHETMDFSLV